MLFVLKISGRSSPQRRSTRCRRRRRFFDEDSDDEEPIDPKMPSLVPRNAPFNYETSSQRSTRNHQRADATASQVQQRRNASADAAAVEAANVL